ncbi:hypothetical protein DMENIID0001_130210 [Sergentomyia squamirostris]
MVTTIKITCDGVCIQSNSYLTNLHLNGNIRNNSVKDSEHYQNIGQETSSNSSNVDQVDRSNGVPAKNRTLRHTYSKQEFPPKAQVYFVRRLSIVSPEEFAHKVRKETPEKLAIVSAPNLGQ